MENKVYILQKDLPNLKKGAEFTFNNGDDYWTMTSDSLRVVTYSKEIVENNSEFFKLKEEKLFTEKQYLKFGEECFKAGRMKEILDGKGLLKLDKYPDKYSSFSEYMNSK